MSTEMTMMQWGIGQGGFHTQTIAATDGNDELVFRFIYDCGVKGDKLPLERAIRAYVRSLPDGCVIDLLYISHWDDDHWNGLPYLKDIFSVKNIKLKQVIAPPKPDLRIRALMQRGSSKAWEDFVANTDDIIGQWFGCPVFNARELYEDEPRGDVATGALSVRETFGGAGREINSKAGVPLWELVPFVQPDAMQDWADANAPLPNIVTTYGELADNLEAVKKNLRSKSNNSLPHSVNSASVLLYSGSPQEACGAWLGTGDANLSDSSEHARMLSNFQGFYATRLPTVSVVNTPHHGSKKSSADGFWGSFTQRVCAVSNASGTMYGGKHKDYHPQFAVRRAIEAAEHCHHVTSSYDRTFTDDLPGSCRSRNHVVGGRK